MSIGESARNLIYNEGGSIEIICKVTNWSQDSGINQRRVSRNKSNILSLKKKPRNNGAEGSTKIFQHLLGGGMFENILSPGGRSAKNF